MLEALPSWMAKPIFWTRKWWDRDSPINWNSVLPNWFTRSFDFMLQAPMVSTANDLNLPNRKCLCLKSISRYLFIIFVYWSHTLIYIRYNIIPKFLSRRGTHLLGDEKLKDSRVFDPNWSMKVKYPQMGIPFNSKHFWSTPLGKSESSIMILFLSCEYPMHGREMYLSHNITSFTSQSL